MTMMTMMMYVVQEYLFLAMQGLEMEFTLWRKHCDDDLDLDGMKVVVVMLLWLWWCSSES